MKTDEIRARIRSTANALGLVMSPNAEADLEWMFEQIRKLREDLRIERRDRWREAATLASLLVSAADAAEP